MVLSDDMEDSDSAIRDTVVGFCAGDSQRLADEVGRLQSFLGDEALLPSDCARSLRLAREHLQSVATTLLSASADVIRPVSLRPLRARTAGAPPIREEGNALTCYAFRHSFLETLHCRGKISDPEMKKLMIEASERLSQMLLLKEETPAEYWRRIRDYGAFTAKWVITPPVPLRSQSFRLFARLAQGAKGGRDLKRRSRRSIPRT